MIDKFLVIFSLSNQPIIINVNKIISIRENSNPLENAIFTIIKFEDGSCIKTKTSFMDIKNQLITLN